MKNRITTQYYVRWGDQTKAVDNHAAAWNLAEHYSKMHPDDEIFVDKATLDTLIRFKGGKVGWGTP